MSRAALAKNPPFEPAQLNADAEQKGRARGPDLRGGLVWWWTRICSASNIPKPARGPEKQRQRQSQNQLIHPPSNCRAQERRGGECCMYFYFSRMHSLASIAIQLWFWFHREAFANAGSLEVRAGRSGLCGHQASPTSSPKLSRPVFAGNHFSPHAP